MMEGIKNWIIVLMVSAVVGEILLMVAPQGNVTKILKVAVSVFFLGCFLAPFAALGNGDLEKISFDYHNEVNSNSAVLDETMQQQTLEEFERNIVQIAAVNLRDLEISPQKIETEINMQEDHSIQIDCIHIWLDSSFQSKEQAMESQLHRVFGYKTEFLFYYEES